MAKKKVCDCSKFWNYVLIALVLILIVVIAVNSSCNLTGKSFWSKWFGGDNDRENGDDSDNWGDGIENDGGGSESDYGDGGENLALVDCNTLPNDPFYEMDLHFKAKREGKKAPQEFDCGVCEEWFDTIHQKIVYLYGGCWLSYIKGKNKCVPGAGTVCSKNQLGQAPPSGIASDSTLVKKDTTKVIKDD